MKNTKRKMMMSLSAIMSAVMISACTPLVQTRNLPTKQQNTIALKQAPQQENAVNNTTTANSEAQVSPEINSQTPAGKFAREGLSIADIVKQNINSVVTVAVTKVENGGIFGSQYQKGVGSGFFIDSSGLVATNNHVVEGATDVQIILNDGTVANGTVAWTDPANDLAVVQMDKSMKVPGVVTIGNSDDVVVGEEVVAIGNPMSAEFAGTVTNGIISAKNRKINVQGREFNYLQTNAAINGGNSGGPLFNSKGAVIGINSAKISQVEIEGISFAIPINTLIQALAGNSGTNQASDNQSYIGIVPADINTEAQELAKSKYNLNLPQGVLITEVAPDSPAMVAGLLANDIIVEFASEKITKGTELNAVKSKHKPGDVIKIIIYRYTDNKYYETELKLAPRP